MKNLPVGNQCCFRKERDEVPILIVNKLVQKKCENMCLTKSLKEVGTLCKIYGLYININVNAKLKKEHLFEQTKGYLHPMLKRVDLKLPSLSCLVLVPYFSHYVGYNT